MKEGQVQPDNSVGRFLADTMASVPRISSDAFDKLFNDSVQVVSRFCTRRKIRIQNFSHPLICLKLKFGIGGSIGKETFTTSLFIPSLAAVFVRFLCG